MLEEAGILTVEDDVVVTLADNWREALDVARELGGEVAAEKAARRDLARKRKAYHNRHKVKPDHHYANVGADGWVEDLRPLGAEAEEEVPRPPEVSALAAAIRDYLDRNPHDACQLPGWIGTTLWAFELYPGKHPPTSVETRAAIGELGGEAYLRELLERSRAA